MQPITYRVASAVGNFLLCAAAVSFLIYYCFMLMIMCKSKYTPELRDQHGNRLTFLSISNPLSIKAVFNRPIEDPTSAFLVRSARSAFVVMIALVSSAVVILFLEQAKF